MAQQIDHVLGKSVSYQFSYDPGVLASVSRVSNREIYGFTNSSTPFAVGYDVWSESEILHPRRHTWAI